MYARPVYTAHPRNFAFYRPLVSGRGITRIGQQAPPQFPPGPMAPGSPPAPAPAPMTPGTLSRLPSGDGYPVPTGDAAVDDAQARVQVVWPYLILASVVGGAAFALGAGLVNRFVFGTK